MIFMEKEHSSKLLYFLEDTPFMAGRTLQKVTRILLSPFTVNPGSVDCN
jgi:hypothetical protein